MKHIIIGDTRKPVAGHLNYGPGIERPDPRQPMGPNTLGEALWPVTFEQANGGTRIGFAFIAPTAAVLAVWPPEWVEVPA